MGKTRNKSRSELEFLRGEVRKLRAELKYYKRREHIVPDEVDEDLDYDDVQDIVKVRQCPVCKHGCLIDYDFYRAILTKCDSCGFQKTQKK